VSSRIEAFVTVLLADEFGEFDVVPMPVSAGTLNLIADGGEIRGVFPLNGQPDGSLDGFWVRRDALAGEEFDPTDLRDERILTPSGPGSFALAYLWATLLEPAGVGATELSAEQFGLGDAAVALMSGAAKAALLFSPFSQQVDTDGCCVLIGGYPEFSTSFYAFGPSLLEDDPDVGRTVVRALARTTARYLQGDYHDDDDLVATLTEVLEQPVEVVTAQPSLVWDLSFPFRTEELGVIQEFYALTGVTTFAEPLEPDDIFDQSFVADLRPR